MKKCCQLFYMNILDSAASYPIRILSHNVTNKRGNINGSGPCKIQQLVFTFKSILFYTLQLKYRRRNSYFWNLQMIIVCQIKVLLHINLRTTAL
jgi:hypothetical protein